jgi:hypothetical protein
MARYFASELDAVIYEIGMKRYKCPQIPTELATHPEYGTYIQQLVAPFKALKSCVSVVKLKE